jgi:hypothetical protein
LLHECVDDLLPARDLIRRQSRATASPLKGRGRLLLLRVVWLSEKGCGEPLPCR